MRISDWSSDVCSSDLFAHPATRGFLFLTLGCRLAFRLRRCLSPRLSPAHTPSPLPLLQSLLVVSPCFIFTLFGRRRKILPLSPSISIRLIPLYHLTCPLHLAIHGDIRLQITPLSR